MEARRERAAGRMSGKQEEEDRSGTQNVYSLCLFYASFLSSKLSNIWCHAPPASEAISVTRLAPFYYRYICVAEKEQSGHSGSDKRRRGRTEEGWPLLKQHPDAPSTHQGYQALWKLRYIFSH